VRLSLRSPSTLFRSQSTLLSVDIMILSVAFALLISGTLALAQTYTVTNSCPTAIELFIGGVSQGNLATGATVVKTGLGSSAGFFYTTTNGGSINGQLVASRVGFYLGVGSTLLPACLL
jgi:hypothetical protein